jgi:membrane-bound acyltransferase YfiQ involved in biofilm formation
MESIKKYQGVSYFRSIFVTMKSVLIFGLLLLSFMSRAALAQEQQVVVPYTLADRDRAIRMEAKFESIDKQFMYQQKQIDDLRTLFYWGFGIVITLILFMFGYMIWDRRTAMKPALEQASKATEDNRNFLTVLRDYSKKHPDLAEILKTNGML